MRDALSNIGHDYSCDDNQYASLNLTTRQLHIVHQGGLGLRRSSDNLGGGKRHELSFIHSKLNALSSIVRIEQKSVRTNLDFHLDGLDSRRERIQSVCQTIPNSKPELLNYSRSTMAFCSHPQELIGETMSIVRRQFVHRGMYAASYIARVDR